MLNKIRNKLFENIAQKRIFFSFYFFYFLIKSLSSTLVLSLNMIISYEKLFITYNLIILLIWCRSIDLFVIFFIRFIIMTSLLKIVKSCVSSRRQNSNVQIWVIRWHKRKMLLLRINVNSYVSKDRHKRKKKKKKTQNALNSSLQQIFFLINKSFIDESIND